ncbi:hypothetical protein [Alicyclobacillus kakegawensis]|uniref:hypothetical protein n=1 Tax=Alicyclobacillus kakegawensis TaxID=392012 RepID=UPI0012ED4B7D|nr:hypothetical protein [Alicyclobacillus kakegawensis]
MAARTNGSLFVVGGYDGHISLTGVDEVWPKHGQLAALPVPTHDVAAGFIGPDLYVFGGGQSASYNTVWRIANGHTTLVDRLPQPLSDASCVPYTWDNAKGLLLVGGYNGVRPNRQVQFVHVTNGHLQWRPLFTLPQGTRYPAVAVAGTRVYIVGGESVQGVPAAHVWVWDGRNPDAPVRTVAKLPQPLSKAAAFTAGKWLIVAGGWNGRSTVSNVYAIEEPTGATKELNNLPLPMADMGYTQQGSFGYLAGGWTDYGHKTQYLGAIYKVKLPAI